MAKPTRKKFDLYRLTVSKVFPPNNQLGIDLLRLMASYNDMSEIADWMGANRSVPTRPISTARGRIRMGIQYRLLMAFMHEALCVLSEMQGGEEYKKLLPSLSESGREALKNLNLSSGTKDGARSRIADARNTVVFHYDASTFAEAVRLYAKVFAEELEAESKIIVERDGRAYYMVPEHLRDLVVFGFESKMTLEDVPEKVGGLIKRVAALQGHLYTFMEQLLNAYIEENGLLDDLRHETVSE